MSREPHKRVPDRDRDGDARLAKRAAIAILLAVALGAGCDDAESVAKNAAVSPELRLNPHAPPTNSQADDLKVEAALEENVVVLDDLIDHGGQATLRPSGRRLFILMAQPNYRTAVYMRQRTEGWGVSQIHGDDLANPIIQAVTALRNTRKADGDDFFVVEVRALHLILVGHRENGTLMLTSTQDRPELGVSANVVHPAASLLQGLVPEARLWATESAKSFSLSASAR